jgi:hypothetical protein
MRESIPMGRFKSPKRVIDTKMVCELISPGVPPGPPTVAYILKDARAISKVMELNMIVMKEKAMPIFRRIDNSRLRNVATLSRKEDSLKRSNEHVLETGHDLLQNDGNMKNEERERERERERLTIHTA